MSVVRFALGSRATVFFVAAASALLGLLAYGSLPRENNPDIQVPLIYIQVAYPGAAPLEVEKQITVPVERELAGLQGLEKLESQSREGLSMLTAEFASGSDVDAALQKVRDRVDLAKVDFPEEAEEPLLRDINLSAEPILQVHLAGDLGPVVLKKLAEDLQDSIEALPGVMRAAVIGGLEREVQIDVDPRRLSSYGLSLDDVVDAVGEENVSIPGGDMVLGDLRYAVRVPGEVVDPLAVADFVIKAEGGAPVFIRDVAEVRFGFEERASFSRIALGGAESRESVSLQVQKRLGSNIIEVVDRVRALVESERSRWPAGVEVAFLADQSVDIHQMVRDLENSILSGLILVLVVLMFALGLRNSAFVALAIPFSMLLTMIALQMSGLTLNMVVLFSLVLAVGMLVDNAVVVIENIYRHMQEGTPRLEAARVATEEVGGAIAVSTFTTVAAFAPILFWPGIIGDFMSFLPRTVILALLASLVVAFTVNPVMCSVFMRAAPASVGKPGVFARWGDRFLERYRRVLVRSLDRPGWTLGLTLLTLVAIAGLFARFNPGIELIPEERPGAIKVDFDLPPGSRIERTAEVGSLLEQRLSGLPDVRVLAVAIGEGSQSDGFGADGPSPQSGRLSLDLVPSEERTQSSRKTLEEARALAGQVPGALIEVDRLSDDLPLGAPLAIEIAGEDLEVLGAAAARVRAALEGIPGLVSLQDDFDLARPEVVIDLDRVEASRLGLTMTDVASTVRTAINGSDASTYRRGDEEIDVVVRLAEGYRSSLDELRLLPLPGPGGQTIPLGGVAQVRRAEALQSINHKDRQRVVTVSGEVTEPSLADPVRREAERRLADLPELLPEGYRLDFAGQKDEEDEAREFLSRAFLWALILVLTLMVGKFDSILVPGIILTSVVMSMFGVLLGLLITGLPFAIVLTGVGVISLAGIVVNNAIVLLDYAEQQRRLGLERREVVVKTGMRRLRPVLLTAITTILGLLPLTTGVELDFRTLSLSTGSESSDYWRSMSVAVIFGLGVATFLTLVVVPVLYDLLWGVRDRLAARRSSSEEGAAAAPEGVG
ncbi:MAG: efflux RND transporter permease subunit [Acidobacteriota bacterium]